MLERFTVAARRAVMRARDEATALRHRYIGSEHLLLALLDPGAEPAYGLLRGAGIDYGRARTGVEKLTGRPEPILSEDDAAALRTVGIDLDEVLAKIEATFGAGALDQPSGPRRLRFGRPTGTPSRPGLNPHMKKVLELAVRDAIQRHSGAIGTGHILLGMIQDERTAGARVLVDAGVDLAALRAAVLRDLDQAA